MTDEVLHPGPSADSIKDSSPRTYSCALCRKTKSVKDILRLFIKERVYYVSVKIIRLLIENGTVTQTSTKIANFLKISHDEHCFHPRLNASDNDMCSRMVDALDCFSANQRRRFCMRHNRKIDWDGLIKRRTREDVEDDEDLMTSFVRRFAEALRLDTFMVEQSIDRILTSYSEILIDMDSQKLKRISKKSDRFIESIIANMFWQPRAKQSDALFYEKRPRGWFCCVDHGYVVPCNVMPIYESQPDKTMDQDVLNCGHVIEETCTGFMSWYLTPVVLDNLSDLSSDFQVAIDVLSKQKIVNPLVSVVDDDPLLLCSHLAHVVTRNFYSNQKYIRKFLYSIDFFKEPFVNLQHGAPYIVRSLNPHTRMHIFHMIYKDKTCEKSNYRIVFDLLVLLREILLNMHIHCVVMPKIGCSCDDLEFERIFEMIKFVFLDSPIKVTVGLKTKSRRCTGCNRSVDSSE